MCSLSLYVMHELEEKLRFSHCVSKMIIIVKKPESARYAYLFIFWSSCSNNGCIWRKLNLEKGRGEVTWKSKVYERVNQMGKGALSPGWINSCMWRISSSAGSFPGDKSSGNDRLRFQSKFHLQPLSPSPRSHLYSRRRAVHPLGEKRWNSDEHLCVRHSCLPA